VRPYGDDDEAAGDGDRDDLAGGPDERRPSRMIQAEPTTTIEST